MSFYADFCIPFIAGATVMFAAIALKYVTWLKRLPKSDLMLIAKGIPTPRTAGAVWEIFRESLSLSWWGGRRQWRISGCGGYRFRAMSSSSTSCR